MKTRAYDDDMDYDDNIDDDDNYNIDDSSYCMRVIPAMLKIISHLAKNNTFVETSNNFF